MAIQPERTGLSRLVGRHAARGGLVVLAGLGWFYAILSTEGFGRQKERLDRRAALRAELAQEKAENDRLASEIAALRTDDFAIEKAARSELDYQRPGEIVVHVENEDPLGVVAPARRPRLVPPPLERESVPARPVVLPSEQDQAAPAAPAEGPVKRPATKAGPMPR